MSDKRGPFDYRQSRGKALMVRMVAVGCESFLTLGRGGKIAGFQDSRFDPQGT
jgi:hypothetical protein